MNDSHTPLDAAKRGNTKAALGFTLGAAVFLFGLWRYSSRPSSDAIERSSQSATEVNIPIPDRLDALEPELRKLIESRADAVRSAPKDAGAIGALGMAYDAHGLSDLAAACYHSAKTMAPNEPRWIHLWAMIVRNHDPAQAQAAFHDVLRLDPTQAPAVEQLGWMAFDRKDWEPAANFFRRVTELRPQEAQGYFALAQVAVAQGRFDDALRDLQSAERYAPRWKAIDYLRGSALQGLGRESEAVADFAVGADARTSEVVDAWRREVSTHAVTRRAQLDYARRLETSGQPDAALKILESLARSHPHEPEIANALAMHYLAQRRFDDAEKTLEALLDAVPDNFPARTTLVQVHIARLDFAPALAHADKAIELAPKVGRAHFQRGVVLTMMGKNDEALEAHQRACRLDPVLDEAFAAMGTSLMRLERWAEAFDAWRRATTLDPANGRYALQRGLTLERLGSLDEAMTWLRKAKILDPGRPVVDEALRRLESAQGRARAGPGGG